VDDHETLLPQKRKSSIIFECSEAALSRGEFEYSAIMILRYGSRGGLQTADYKTKIKKIPKI
jgi:hypothetical protein